MDDDGVVGDHLQVPVDGAELSVRLRGASPPCLLYLHHQSGTGDLVPEQIHGLAERGVALPDILDTLEVDSVVIGGVSFGAGVALATVLGYPSRVSGLVLWSSPYAGTRRGWTASQRRSLERTFAIAESVFSNGGVEGIGVRGKIDPTVDVDRETQRWLRHDPLSFASALLTVGFQQPFDTLDELATIAVATVVIPGADQMHPPEIGAAYAASIPLARVADEEGARGAIDALLTSS